MQLLLLRPKLYSSLRQHWEGEELFLFSGNDKVMPPHAMQFFGLLQTLSPLLNSPAGLHTELNSIRSISYPFPYKPLLRLYVTQLALIQNYCV